MRDDHIVDLLDGTPLGRLAADERARVEAHALECSACRRAYDAARVGADLVAARSRASVEPPPFFHTRVMAALRERRDAEEGGLARMWRAAWGFVAAMATAVALLAGSAYLTAQPEAPAAVAEAPTPYSADWDYVADSGQPELSDDQLVAILYDESEDLYGQGR
jgi:anti-sigma factor RsiW